MALSAVKISAIIGRERDALTKKLERLRKRHRRRAGRAHPVVDGAERGAISVGNQVPSLAAE